MNLLAKLDNELKDKNLTDFEKVRYIYLRTCELFSFDNVTTTVKIPSWDKCFLSLKTILPTSPTPNPSTNTWPKFTVPFLLMEFLF